MKTGNYNDYNYSLAREFSRFCKGNEKSRVVVKVTCVTGNAFHRLTDTGQIWKEIERNWKEMENEKKLKENGKKLNIC